ncbi:MAG: class I SAM-dependent methyltransferase [Chloroflexota bacterium]
MDDLIKYNQERWQALVDAGVEFSVPYADYDQPQAIDYVDQWADIKRLELTNWTGKDVLCLASGGGQQSVCFSLMGGNVSVRDLTPGQLAGDRAMAEKYGYSVRTELGDMRDLSCFEDQSFDLVYQAYSINFIPDPWTVFAEVKRVLRPGGLYYLQFANPLWNMEETDWTEKGYPIRQPYVQGQQSTPEKLPWDVEQPDGSVKKVDGPDEFTHTMGTIFNGLGNNGMLVFAMIEMPKGDAAAEPGTWEHLKSYLPVWPAVWAKKL